MNYQTQEILDGFESELKLKGRSEATIKHYTFHVRQFSKYIGSDLHQISSRIIKEYISYIYAKKFALNTIKLKIRSLKQFYKYLHETGQIFINPSENLKEPVGHRNLPKTVMTSAEMESILNSIPESSLIKLRDRAIIAVLYSTGLRLSELVHLDLSDVNLSEGMLQVRNGKGGFDRQAILTKETIRTLSLYLEKRREIPDESPALWINFKGTRIRKCWIQTMLRDAAKKVGVTTASNPHAWRHSLATGLLRCGASIREVQVFLGHRSISSTEIYTHLTILDLQKMHRKTHPREFDPLPSEIFDAIGSES